MWLFQIPGREQPLERMSYFPVNDEYNIDIVYLFILFYVCKNVIN